MKVNELRAAVVRAGMSMEMFAKKLGISKKSLYSRLNGNVEFELDELRRAKKTLALSNEAFMDIFFDDKVS